MKRDCDGFTLIELVTSILLVTILAVFIAPRFLGPSQFAAVAARDALIAELRRMQQARLSGQACTLTVTPSEFALTDVCADGQNDPYSLEDVTLAVTLQDGSSSDTFTLTMDSLGRADGPAVCANGCVINIGGGDPQLVTIGAEGYIR